MKNIRNKKVERVGLILTILFLVNVVIWLFLDHIAPDNAFPHLLIFGAVAIIFFSVILYFLRMRFSEIGFPRSIIIFWCSVLLLLLFYFLHYGQEPGLSVFNLARNYEHVRKPSDFRGLSIWTVEVKIICRNKHCAHVRSILSGWMNEILKEKNDWKE